MFNRALTFGTFNPCVFLVDDGGIIGDVDLLKKVWDLLQTRGPAWIAPQPCEM